MLRATVQTWLTNPAISNLQLHAISDRFNDERIVSFLWSSAQLFFGVPDWPPRPDNRLDSSKVLSLVIVTIHTECSELTFMTASNSGGFFHCFIGASLVSLI
jgi:hypothetical protein